MADAATLQTRLTEAETALHRLMTGSSAERVQTGDKQVTYRKADMGALRAYIAELQLALGQQPRRRAAAVSF